jgi:purine nucleosidase
MRKGGLLLLTLILLSTGPVARETLQPLPVKNVILDVDTSGDDIMAILYLLDRPDIDIKAITLVHGVSHVEQGAEIVLRILALTGHSNIPVIKGAEIPMEGNNAFPDKWQPSIDQPFGLKLPPHNLKPAAGNASGVISSLLKKYAGNISILALGPLTNVAEAFIKEPALAGLVKSIYISDGAVYIAGAIQLEYPAIHNTVSGWNLWVDARAASVVFNSGAPIKLVPLDLTAVHSPNPLLLRSEVVRQFNSLANGNVSKSLAAVLNNWITYYHTDTKINNTEQQAPVWDLVAAEIFCNNDICSEWQPQFVDIKTGDPETAGQILLTKGKKPNTDISLRGNQELFDAELIKAAK